MREQIRYVFVYRSIVRGFSLWVESRDHRGLTRLILIIVQFVSFKQGQMGTWTFLIVKCG